MGFWKRCFSCSERLVSYIKRRKSFFHDLFSRSITWEYRGLQGVTWGNKGLQAVTRTYKGLHGVTRGYRGLQGVTRGYKGLQGITGGYKGLQGVTGGDKGLQEVTIDFTNFFVTRTFPDTFSWSIVHKNQSWRNLKFWPKRWTNPYGKILILHFSYTVVFVVFKGFFFI